MRIPAGCFGSDTHPGSAAITAFCLISFFIERKHLIKIRLYCSAGGISFIIKFTFLREFQPDITAGNRRFDGPLIALWKKYFYLFLRKNKKRNHDSSICLYYGQCISINLHFALSVILQILFYNYFIPFTFIQIQVWAAVFYDNIFYLVRRKLLYIAYIRFPYSYAETHAFSPLCIPDGRQPYRCCHPRKYYRTYHHFIHPLIPLSSVAGNKGIINGNT